MQVFLFALGCLAFGIMIYSRLALNDYTKWNDANGVKFGIIGIVLWLFILFIQDADYRATAYQHAREEIARLSDIPGVTEEDISLEDVNCISENDSDECIHWIANFRHSGELQLLSTVSVVIEPFGDEFVSEITSTSGVFVGTECDTLGPENFSIGTCIRSGTIDGVHFSELQTVHDGCTDYLEPGICQRWLYEFDLYYRGSGRLIGKVEFSPDHIIRVEFEPQ